MKPEQIKEFDIRRWDIAELIRMIENEEERQQYLIKGQSLEDESLYLSIANAIKVNNNINSFLVYKKIKEFDLSGSDIVNLIEVIEDDKNRQDCALSFLNYQKMQEYGIEDNALITKLIKLTGNIEIFLFDGQNANDANLLLNMSNVIKGQNCCPELDREEIELLCSFKDKDIILSVINLDVTKQKEAIFILDRLSKSNSAELGRIKIPMALQILEKNPSETTETNAGDFRYKGVVIEGINQEIDVDLSFTERTDEIEYSTDECIKDRLSTIRSKSEEDYKYVIANILLAKKFLKQAGAYKRANAEVPKEGEVDTRGGLGGVGIENWNLQNNGSFIKAAESFIKTANKYDNQL